MIATRSYSFAQIPLNLLGSLLVNEILGALPVITVFLLQLLLSIPITCSQYSKYAFAPETLPPALLSMMGNHTEGCREGEVSKNSLKPFYSCRVSAGFLALEIWFQQEFLLGDVVPSICRVLKEN